MKKLLILLLLASPAGATDYARQLCALETVNASNIMMMRQNGYARRALERTADAADGEARQRHLTMVDEAYRVPPAATTAQRRDIAFQFGQIWAHRCRARHGF